MLPCPLTTITDHYGKEVSPVKRVISLLLLFAMLIVPPALGEAYSVTAFTALPDDEAARDNIELAAGHIDATFLPGGEIFSFNVTVGPRTSAYGYQSAVNGRGVKVVGGGVAQVATTLYLALAQLDNVEYTSLETYGASFAGDYVRDGDEAILVDYSSGIDFGFVDTGEDLFIEMWTSDEKLYCCVSCGDEGDQTLSWGFDATEMSDSFIASAEIELDGTDEMIDNITLAANSVNDTVLEPGDVFSFNDTVGPRNTRYGYRSAVNGRGVKVIGGGVAQVASVLWLAVKNLDNIAIVQKSTYGKRYNQSYVESSNDAILTDYVNGTDFSFKNIGEDTITISTRVDDGVLYCYIYS